MKALILVAFFAIAAYASAGIVPEVIYDGLIEGEDGKIINLEDVDTHAGLSTITESSPIRHRRVTCDVLSLGTKWGSPSKIACPVRCLAQGRRGGSCKDGVCVCH